MTTRRIEDILADVRHASSISDAKALLRYAQELEALASPDAAAAASMAWGSAELLQGNYAFALEHYHKALEQCERLGNRVNVSKVTSNIGIVHYQTGNFPLSLEYNHRALAVFEELGNRHGVADVIGNIGLVYSNTGNYPLALEHFHRALSIHEELSSHAKMASVTGSIGGVYTNTGDYTKALEYFHRALAIYETHGDSIGMAGSMSNIGYVHKSTGNYSLALEHYYRALAISESLGDRVGIARVKGSIGNVLVATEHFAVAEELLQEMDSMQIDGPKVKINREWLRAALQEHNGEIDVAVATLNAALEMASQHALASDQADVHRRLRDLSQKRNDLAGYIEHNNEYTRITEEINGKEATQKLAMMEAESKMANERAEHEKHLSVLHSTLPKTIADRVARGETVNDHYDNASVIFLDIAGFTTISEQLSSEQVVQLLDSIFTTLDAVCEKHDVMKIKTIGDSYMAVAFPAESSSSEQRAASAALDMLHAISHIVSPASSPEGSPLQVRIGIHSGAVTAGIIGTTRMQYDVWGDTVNVASRMESTSSPGRIHVSDAFATALSLRLQDQRLQEQRHGDTDVIPSETRNTDVIPSASEEQGIYSPFPIPYSLRERGALEIKGKGTMTTYWLDPA